MRCSGPSRMQEIRRPTEPAALGLLRRDLQLPDTLDPLVVDKSVLAARTACDAIAVSTPVPRAASPAQAMIRRRATKLMSFRSYQFSRRKVHRQLAAVDRVIQPSLSAVRARSSASWAASARPAVWARRSMSTHSRGIVTLRSRHDAVTFGLQRHQDAKARSSPNLSK